MPAKMDGGSFLHNIAPNWCDWMKPHTALTQAQMDQIQQLALDLATKPQPQSEIDRIVQPKLEQARRNTVTNVGYWMELLSNAHDDPGGMQYIRTELSDYASITPADVMAAAKKWFKPETAWRLQIVPGPGVQ